MIEEYLNKIHNVDCIEATVNLPDQSVQMVLTDIPYNEVNFNKSVNQRAKYDGQLRKFTKGEADELNFDLQIFLNEVKRVVKGSVYIFCGINQLPIIFNYFKHENEKEFMSRVCVWSKTNPPVANGQHMWTQGTEFCVFAKRRKTKFNEHCKKNVWEFPVGRSKIHPTEKPLKLFQYLIESSSDEGDIILDPCIGSGTTAEACINLGRNYIGYEINKEYFDIANQRINKLIINT
jgi:DNA modification methylase